MKWYIVKKKNESRWTAYPFPDGPPKLKEGYEMRGPYPSVMKAWMEANKLRNDKN